MRLSTSSHQRILATRIWIWKRNGWYSSLNNFNWKYVGAAYICKALKLPEFQLDPQAKARNHRIAGNGSLIKRSGWQLVDTDSKQIHRQYICCYRRRHLGLDTSQSSLFFEVQRSNVSLSHRPPKRKITTCQDLHRPMASSVMSRTAN